MASSKACNVLLMASDFASRRDLLLWAGALPAESSLLSAAVPPGTDRAYFLSVLDRLARPVLNALSKGKLKESMPVEVAPGADVNERRRYTHLEALGRLLAGIAPWLESGNGSDAENVLREEYARLARLSITAAVDPSSPDYMNFTAGAQPVVDAAFLALGLLRAPRELWTKLDDPVKRQLIAALQSTRVIRPGFNNWLLFSAAIEAFLGFAGSMHDDMRIDYAIRQHEQWYMGDGVYGDGPQFHWDYYNSFVIHPMLLQVVETAGAWSDVWKPLQPAILARSKRYAAIQERLIGPDGSFPPMGRSLAYRCGAFHSLANMALLKLLPNSLSAGQTRSALTAVVKRTMEAPATFDSGGWLTIGLCGHQPGIAETYISTGSLYLCSTALLPLGLLSTDQFWTDPAVPWTSKLAWGGEQFHIDHAL